MKNIDLTKLQKISFGYEYTVYALNDDSVLKVSNGHHIQNSGRVLEELQGLPFIPKVYDYGEDWLIMQRIYGSTMFGYGRGWSWFRVQYDYENHKNNALNFCDDCMKKGWIPKDLNVGNVMIDIEGDFWIVDVGSFIKTEESVFPSKQYKKLLGYGRIILNSYEHIQNWIDLFGPEKMYELCNPNYPKLEASTL
ncbi:hypothetical protein ABM560_07320 [Bacillus albus]|uniref:hypothetical protein n=1 Tax=Bacillus albus TaxID=2026189 RepID=UPI0032C424C1